MNLRKGVIAGVGAATLAASVGSMAFGLVDFDPTSGAARGGGGGGGGGGGIGVVVATAGCSGSNSNATLGTQVVSRSGNHCGSVKSSQRANDVANGGKGGRGGNARSGSAFNRF